MDNVILKKRLNTHKTDKGTLKNVTDDLLCDILRAWESWPGTSKDFYTSIGVSSMQMAKLMGKAKKLQREGRFPASDFKEVHLEAITGGAVISNTTGAIEIAWEQGKVIRFAQVDLLVDFLKKVA